MSANPWTDLAVISICLPKYKLVLYQLQFYRPGSNTKLENIGIVSFLSAYVTLSRDLMTIPCDVSLGRIRSVRFFFSAHVEKDCMTKKRTLFL